MASLDKTLGDIIKSRRNIERSRGQGRPQRGRGPGGSFRGGRTTGTPRRAPLGVNRPSASTIAKSIRRTKSLPWQNGLFEESLKAAGMSVLDNGTKLYVSNLDVGVTNEDIRELFGEIGELVHYAIHYDKNARPSGSAEVFFARRSDALQALKRYNNVQLDGKPMKIEIVGLNTEIPVSARVNVVEGANGRRRTVIMTGRAGRNSGPTVNRGAGQRSRGGLRGSRGHGGGLRGSRGRGGGLRGSRGHAGGRGISRGQWRKKTVEKSADQLDKELEDYHAQAMQT